MRVIQLRTKLSHSTWVSTIFAMLLLTGCSKDDEPVAEDLFKGAYQLSEVIEEFDPQEPGSEDERFLAPSAFEITKESFLDPTTGQFVEGYKICIEGDFIMGLNADGETKLSGAVTCPVASDIQTVEVEILTDIHQLTMVSCEFRTVVATYNLSDIETP